MSRPSAVVAIGLVLLGLAARAALMAPLLRPGPGPADPDNYLELAGSLAGGEGYRLSGRPTAYRPPLYPILLAPGVALLGNPPIPWVIGLHLVAGGATVALTGLAARRWGLGPRAMAVAMLVVAVDPVLVAQARDVMTETTAALLVAALLATIGPAPTVAGAVGTGLVAGLAALCRPSLLPIASSLAVAVVAVGPGTLRGRVVRASALLAAVVATLAPWAIRNEAVLGAPVWTTTHGGYTLLLANNRVYYDEVLNGPLEVWSGPNQRAWFDRVTPLAVGKKEPESDRMYRSMALEVIRDRPADFARATLDRLGRFWAIAPSAAVYPGPVRWAAAAWTAPLWALLIVGMLRRPGRSWPGVAAWAAILALTAVHALFWTDLRMRAPIVPAIALAAAGAVGGRHAGRSGA